MDNYRLRKGILNDTEAKVQILEINKIDTKYQASNRRRTSQQGRTWPKSLLSVVYFISVVILYVVQFLSFISAANVVKISESFILRQIACEGFRSQFYVLSYNGRLVYFASRHSITYSVLPTSVDARGSR